MYNISKFYNFPERLIEDIESVEQSLSERFLELEKIYQYNQAKVLKAMQNNNLNSSDFFWTTGYGYGDVGREKVESIYSEIFCTEDALVRPSIASGTHAIFLTLNSLLGHGDELAIISDEPYDTMQKAIGIKGNEPNNLISKGIKVNILPLKNNKIDIENLKNIVTKETKVAMIQRSMGYSDRPAFRIDEIKKAVAEIKAISKDIIVFCDNCYGEFTDIYEPTEVGVDIMAGSLIKNPGGGLAVSGGYIVGKKELIELVANNLTAPGIGKEVGLTFGTSRLTLQGLFLAPMIVKEACKGALLFQNVYTKKGFDVTPNFNDNYTDIVVAIKFNDPEKLKLFTITIQKSSTVDSNAIPTAWDMPGYDNKVIMASGSFISGSSIELSADAPIRAPYIAYFQGGLTYMQSKIALMNTLVALNLY